MKSFERLCLSQLLASAILLGLISQQSVWSQELTTPGQESTKVYLPEPQHPILLNGFDGVMYIYQTDCCMEDGHQGILFSYGEVATGCNGDEISEQSPLKKDGQSESDPADSTPKPETDSIVCTKFHVNNAVRWIDCNFNSPLTIWIDTRLTENRMPAQQKPPRPDSKLVNRYDTRNPLGTVVKIAYGDQKDKFRFFTLVRYRHAGCIRDGNDQDNPDCRFEIDLPLLILSRPQRDRIMEGGQRNPPNFDIEAETDIDLNNNHFGVVRINVPVDSTSSRTVPLDCFMINRKD